MQIPFQSFAQDSVLQIRAAMRRVTSLHASQSRGVPPSLLFGGLVELPKPEAVAWEDTEIDVRRVVL